MASYYEFDVSNQNFKELGYIIAGANLKDKHDRSAPSDFHWKILKCRMMIFSNSDILAWPDERDVKKIHIIFSKIGDDYDKVNCALIKFSLTQDGDLRPVTEDIYKNCFQYTMTAKMAPEWNLIGGVYYIYGREFLTNNGPQYGVQFWVQSTEHHTSLNLKPVKITLIHSKGEPEVGEPIRVLPSLNKAIVEDRCDKMPESAKFKCYKDLKRHWKNIHGYRLPAAECPYYLIRFWRGDPLTYPKICVTSQYPIVVPIPKHDEQRVISKFLNDLKNKMSYVVREPITITGKLSGEKFTQAALQTPYNITQGVSLCTPTQQQKN